MKLQHLKGKRHEKAVTTQKDTPQEGALSDELQERIAKRAYELYLERGCREGCDVEDWLNAEREVLLTLPQGRPNVFLGDRSNVIGTLYGRREKVPNR